MAEVAELSSVLRKRWLKNRLEIKVVDTAELSQVRSVIGMALPAEFEAFLTIVGLPNDEDSEGFRFWSPGELRLSSDVLRNKGHAYVSDHPSLIFADYLQESWWYGLWLAGPSTGDVSLLLPVPEPPLGTLGEFLRAYLADDSRLYPPALRGSRDI